MRIVDIQIVAAPTPADAPTQRMARSCSSTVRIRAAQPSEAEALTELALAAKAAWGYDHAQLAAWRPLLAVTAQQLAEQPAYVAEDRGERLGFYTLRHADARWELDNLWVAPAWMQRGVGRLLLAHAVRVASSRGATERHIDADPNAEPFYLRCGAERRDAAAAPIAGQPARVRPQLVLDLRANAAQSAAGDDSHVARMKRSEIRGERTLRPLAPDRSAAPDSVAALLHPGYEG
ncbi:MAG: GNAT family N-acetyltransferase [Burkholderiales bacterium]|jgi:GNAT superfamily N-acetyltransferase|nr:GNAT family N-acetyltransferase [Burkholderiales bacterium]